MKGNTTQAGKDELVLLSLKSSSLDADKLLYIYVPPSSAGSGAKTLPPVKAEVRPRANWQY
jgi:hypothetical protein